MTVKPKAPEEEAPVEEEAPPEEPLVGVEVYTSTPRDRISIDAMLHTYPALRTARLTVAEWDARLVAFYLADPEGMPEDLLADDTSNPE